jgi:precorrin-6B methylase 2
MSFPIYRELGVFSVLGIIYSFLFVQVLFPRIIPEVPPVGRKLRLPLEIVPQVMYRVSGRATFTVMLLLFCVMLSFARPVFHVDINDMNTITSGTMAAESEIKGRWGDPAGGTLLVAEGSSLAELMERIDALTEYVVSERKQGNVAAFFSPALLWPGKRLGAANISAWKNFFNSERVAELRKTLHDTATEFDFSDDAFDPFLRDVESPNASGSDWPAGTVTIFGVRRGLTGGQWMSAIRLAPSEPDAVEKIFRVTSANGMGRLLDAGRYARSLSSAVADTFKDMLLIIGLGNLLMLVIYFMDAQLVLLASAPIVFSVVCTLGTMNLMGHPLDIPSIIFMIVVLGMGIDYGLYFICSYQRYRDDRGGYYSSIIVAVFLAAVSTVAGFGCMALSGNKLLSSAGLITSLGLCYSLLGAFFIVPPILRLIYRPGTDHGEVAQAGSDRHRALVLRRYRHAETTPRMFARFKIMLDPMFARLGDFVKNGDRILDIGTGYGVPAVWLATCRSGLTIWGVEPESERARVAAAALGASGTVTCTGAPKLPDLLHPADVALMIDIAHYLSDQELGETLHGIAEKLAPGGRLVVRASVPRESKAFAPFHRALETFRLKICHRPCFYRAKSHIEDQLRKAGFAVESVEPSAPGREETWFLARSPGGSGKP